MPLSECIRYHKVGATKNDLASIILQSTKKKLKTLSFLKVFGIPPPC